MVQNLPVKVGGMNAVTIDKGQFSDTASMQELSQRRADPPDADQEDGSLGPILV